MNKQQYESLPDDLKLDAKLAIVLGEEIMMSDDPDNIGLFAIKTVANIGTRTGGDPAKTLLFCGG